MTPEQVAEEVRKFRELLWLRHGCDFNALYGDDGEMHCNKCLIDFKRSSAASIEEVFYRKNAHRAFLSCGAVDANGSPVTE